MIEEVSTFNLIEEYSHTNSAPMKFTCTTPNGYEVYFVKYVLGEDEFDFLVYELVCQRLAKHFDINTPDIALVNVAPDSFNYEQLKRNKKYFKPGVIAFGSKEVVNNDLITKHTTVPNKHTFKTYAAPEDLVKIALFDLHTYNKDRTEDNYNILLGRNKPSLFYVIDHFYCFGGTLHAGTFNSSLKPEINGTILRSKFFTNMVSYMSLKDLEKAVKNYFYLYEEKAITTILDDVFYNIPKTWSISGGLKERLYNFLTDKARLNVIDEDVINYLRFIKNKK
jgi:hypothetical protein